jgi:hypothetical protein
MTLALPIRLAVTVGVSAAVWILSRTIRATSEGGGGTIATILTAGLTIRGNGTIPRPRSRRA